MSSNNVQNYHQQGGAVWVVGGRLDLNGSWFINGTQVTVTAAQLNAIDSVTTVANKTGGDLVKGTIVYLSGYDTTLGAPSVTEADADDPAKKATLVLTEAIANNASGTAESEAVITAVDTSAYSAVGSFVYESTTAGESTQMAPTDADDDRRVVCVVKVKDAAVGEIYYFPGRGGLEYAAVYLNNITPGTVKANGAVIADSNLNIGIAKVTALHIGASGSETEITSTAAELNLLDLTAQTETVDAGDVVSVLKRITFIDNTTSGAGSITLATPDASMVGQVKVIEMKIDNGDVTLSLTNVQGGTAATTCTWANAGEALILVAGEIKWNVVSEGGVVLS